MDLVRLSNPDFGNGMELVGAVTRDNPLEDQISASGFSRYSGQRGIAREKRVKEGARLLRDALNGAIDPVFLKEALTPSNDYLFQALRENYPDLFPSRGGRIEGLTLRETMSYTDYSALTVDIIDRLLYGYYTTAPLVTMPLVKKKALRDFRLVARYAMDGATAPFRRMPNDTTLTPHGAGEPPTERAMQQEAQEVEGSSQRVTYQPQLYQGMMSVNWRAFINDDLGIFSDMTQRLAISGRRSIATFITSLYWSTTGPNTTLFNSTFGNLCIIAYGASSNNPSLGFQGLSDAFTILYSQKDLDGQPIQFDGTVYLVVPPSLKTTAISLTKARQANLSILGGNQNVQGFPTAQLNVDNWIGDLCTVVEDKWMPIVSNNNTNINKSWMLVYDPSTQPRPSAEMGFLTGFDTPQLYQKVPNTMRVGGGVDPSLGDFYSMNQEWKGVLVFGGGQIDGRSAVVSTGGNQ